MTLYVDPLVHHGWRLRGHTVRSCHLFSDRLDLTELHTFAARLGMKPAWFQSTSTPHYDLTERRRADAVRLGALEVSRRAAVVIWRALRAERRSQGSHVWLEEYANCSCTQVAASREELLGYCAQHGTSRRRRTRLPDIGLEMGWAHVG